MFTADDAHFPCLKAKAAEVRHLGPALLRVWTGVMDASNTQHKQIKLCLEVVVKMESMLDTYSDDYRFPPDAAAEWERCTVAFVQLNTALGQYYHPRLPMKVFHFTIKYHYMLHIGLIGRYMNPRLGWCYAGEDFMKRCKSIVQACQDGSPAHLVAAKATAKYVRGLGLTLHTDLLKR